MENLSNTILLTLLTSLSLILVFTNTYTNGDIAAHFVWGAALAGTTLTIQILVSFLLDTEVAEQL